MSFNLKLFREKSRVDAGSGRLAFVHSDRTFDESDVVVDVDDAFGREEPSLVTTLLVLLLDNPSQVKILSRIIR